jgi:hypothetical protein
MAPSPKGRVADAWRSGVSGGHFRRGSGDARRQKGYHVHATDGDLGHVENFLADDVNWDIRYLVISSGMYTQSAV